MHSMTDAAIIGLVTILILPPMIMWGWYRPERILERWLKTYGYRLIEKRRLVFNIESLLGSTATYFYITVESETGWVRHGRVQCGGWWFGDKVTVTWTDAKP